MTKLKKKATNSKPTPCQFSRSAEQTQHSKSKEQFLLSRWTKLDGYAGCLQLWNSAADLEAILFCSAQCGSLGQDMNAAMEKPTLTEEFDSCSHTAHVELKPFPN